MESCVPEVKRRDKRKKKRRNWKILQRRKLKQEEPPTIKEAQMEEKWKIHQRREETNLDKQKETRPPSKRSEVLKISAQ